MAKLRQRLRNSRTVVVDASGLGDFKTINDACTYIASQAHTIDAPWVIKVIADNYNGDTFTLPTFTTIMYEGSTDEDGNPAGLVIESATGSSAAVFKGPVKLNTVSILSGSGTPEAAVAAPVGSLFLRTDGSTSTTLYVKTTGTGNTGWTAK